MKIITELAQRGRDKGGEVGQAGVCSQRQEVRGGVAAKARCKKVGCEDGGGNKAENKIELKSCHEK